MTQLNLFANDWVKDHWEEGANCPNCGQFVKLYKRQLNSQMARQLISIYRFFRTVEFESPYTWLHTSSHLRQCGLDRECAKLRLWGLIYEQVGTRDDGGQHRGFYRISELGRNFAMGLATVPKFIYCYNGKLVEMPEPDLTRIHITEALGSRFNHQELMNATPETT